MIFEHLSLLKPFLNDLIEHIAPKNELCTKLKISKFIRFKLFEQH